MQHLVRFKLLFVFSLYVRLPKSILFWLWFSAIETLIIDFCQEQKKDGSKNCHIDISHFASRFYAYKIMRRIIMRRFFFIECFQAFIIWHKKVFFIGPESDHWLCLSLEILKLNFDQDLSKNLCYELNPRVRCAFGNVSFCISVLCYNPGEP